jgi:cobyrinic acid a,c-diamide synthase
VVQAFKCGPDYIDAGHLTAAADRPCRNLDTWMLPKASLSAQFAQACRGADIAVIEGVMGLYDGSDFLSSAGSAAEIAQLLSAPVLLVTDISGSGRSVAATVRGFQLLEPGVPVAAVAFNQAGSKGHALGCAEAVRQCCGLPMLGWLPREQTLAVPERHLGLEQALETRDNPERLARLAERIAEGFDLDALLRLAAEAPALEWAEVANVASARLGRATKPLLAVAQDEAFSFHYPENLELLEAAGARLQPFSPLRGEAPGSEAAGVYLGGGYPELHAGALSENRSFLERLREMHGAGLPVYAECGGFMALTEALVDSQQKRWPMAGLIPGEAWMTTRLAGLGYREVEALSDNLLVSRGTRLRGHEFHHSEWRFRSNELGTGAAWYARNVRGGEEVQCVGFCRGNLLAGYLHLHFAQSPALAESFVHAMVAAMAR